MAKIFDMTETGEPSGTTKELVSVLTNEIDIQVLPGTDDQNWRDITEALFVLFVRQLLKADDPHAAIDTAIELLEAGHKRI